MRNINSHAELMTAIEEYYGPYNSDFKREIVIAYVKKNFVLDELDNLFINLRQKYPSQYKTPPGEDVFYLLRNGSPEAKAEQAWAEMSRYNSGHSILCTDPAAQEAVKSMGGWDDFCEYRSRDNHWCHQDFLSRYESLSQSARHADPEVLKGFAAKYYRKEIAQEDVKLIGDKAQGQALLRIAMQNVSGQMPGLNHVKDLIKIPEAI